MQYLKTTYLFTAKIETSVLNQTYLCTYVLATSYSGLDVLQSNTIYFIVHPKQEVQADFSSKICLHLAYKECRLLMYILHLFEKKKNKEAS